ncbi:MAG TPA: hypothetical protein VK158_02280 [Acidobacteriota bacterium]|nr:hypothetical protein [Acidobacteriota bacterium]
MFLGVLIVLIVALGALWWSYKTQADEQDIARTTPTSPIEKFVDSCLESTTREALVLLGTQGGYTTLPSEIERNPRLTFSAHPNKPVKTPLWTYSQQQFAPSIETMQTQLANYIQSQIPQCLDNLEPLQDLDDIKAVSEPLVSVKINDRDVSVKLDYSIERASQSVGTMESKSYVFVQPVQLKKIYQNAIALTNAAIDQEFFEYMTINLMASAESTIPMSNIQFKCGPAPTWTERNVKNNLTSLLTNVVPLIRVRGAENRPFESQDEDLYERLQDVTPDDFTDARTGKDVVPRVVALAPADAYEYAHLYMDIGQESDLESTDLSVSFRYLPTFGMDFVVRPNDNGILRGTAGTGDAKYLSYLCMKVYHFTYDVVYPIEVSFVDEDAFLDGSPFVFRFGVPVQINHNLPDKSDFSLSTLEPSISRADLCEDTVDTPTQIAVIDDATEEFISNAQISYKCFRYACDLGVTSTEGVRSQLITRLPAFCGGFTITAQKSGYLPSSTFVNDPNAQNQIQLSLIPTQRIPYSVVLGPKSSTPTSLKSNQEAIISLQNNDIKHDVYATFIPGGDDNYLELINGKTTYNATVIVYEDGAMIGGYVGTLDVERRAKGLRLYSHDFIDPAVDYDQEYARLQLLTNDTIIRDAHGQVWQ